MAQTASQPPSIMSDTDLSHSSVPNPFPLASSRTETESRSPMRPDARIASLSGESGRSSISPSISGGNVLQMAKPHGTSPKVTTLQNIPSDGPLPMHCSKSAAER